MHAHVLSSSLESGRIDAEVNMGKIALMHIGEKLKRLLDAMVEGF